VPDESALPKDDLSHGEWIYLKTICPDDEQFQERSDRFIWVLRRLIRKGHDPRVT